MLALLVPEEFAESFAAEQSTGYSILACTFSNKSEGYESHNLDWQSIAVKEKWKSM